jgi:hypothetical protein
MPFIDAEDVMVVDVNARLGGGQASPEVVAFSTECGSGSSSRVGKGA